MDEELLKLLMISSDTTLKDAMERLDVTCEKILFVVDEREKLWGTVTDGDIRRGLIAGLGFKDKIEKVMCTDFISLATDERDMTKRAKKLIAENKIEQIPVLDGEGIMIDVVLWTDFLDVGEAKKKIKHTNNVVVMAGGKGTRLEPFTKVLPKPLIPIGDKPIIELIMERFHDYGFSNFIYTLNYKKEYLKLYLKENDFPYSIDWIEESDYLGTAGSLSLLKEKLINTFFVINCDSLLDVNYEQVLEWHIEQKAAITVVGCYNEVKIPFGVLELSNGKLKRIHEKPVQDVMINTGLYVMEPSTLNHIPNASYMDMNSLLETVSKTENVSVYPIHDGWIDMGQWDEYQKSLKSSLDV